MIVPRALGGITNFVYLYGSRPCTDVEVHRYDARLLLEGPHPFHDQTPLSPVPPSPGGWSDLPSDSEDTFFLSPEETEDFARVKRQRALERLREERMRALAEEEACEPETELWGGSDEEAGDFWCLKNAH